MKVSTGCPLVVKEAQCIVLFRTEKQRGKLHEHFHHSMHVIIYSIATAPSCEKSSFTQCVFCVAVQTHCWGYCLKASTWQHKTLLSSCDHTRSLLCETLKCCNSVTFPPSLYQDSLKCDQWDMIFVLDHNDLITVDVTGPEATWLATLKTFVPSVFIYQTSLTFDTMQEFSCYPSVWKWHQYQTHTTHENCFIVTD